MKRAMTDAATRRRAIDPLDTDLLEPLEERDKRLYAIVSKAIRYRGILSEEVKRLRIGGDPEVVRAMLARWDTLIREIQRLAVEL
jgi:hypothetical protein